VCDKICAKWRDTRSHVVHMDGVGVPSQFGAFTVVDADLDAERSRY
jgi:hypothetical protein